ncbi:STAS domain-containing protein [Pedobacter sp. SYSU D00535]|uniref:STAS domain-containing protein n=1 Tax=Pedobacter sp. SYSU D00535 TaxID=2810308 RepID=UPI001A970A27|nr:STAS domain-containing protein [Pedobacter sp. SYSU D00535]
MMIETHQRSNYTEAKLLIKEANLDVAEQFKSEIQHLVDRGHTHIIVNFENVAYVDSSFLGALVSVLKYCMSKKGDIAVAGLNKDISNLFNLIRMNKVFKVFNSLPDAFA